MLTRIRTRLSFSHLLVLMFGMVLAGLLMWFVVEEIYLSAQRENLLAQAKLTAAALEGNQEIPFSADLYSQTTNITPGIHTRLLDEGGGVLIGLPVPRGEDPVQVPASEDPGFVPAAELVRRQEIITALAGNPATAIRTLESLNGERVLYAAAPVKNSAGEVQSLVYLATPLPSGRLPSSLAVRLGGAVLLAGTVASLLGLVLASTIARPLEHLDQAASGVAAGDLDQVVSRTSSITELANLGQTFNQMTTSLRQSDQAKTAFIADVTHELRTPLTVIKGTLETFQDGGLDDIPGRSRLLGSMSRETDRLIQLVNDLLLLTRSDAGALSLNIKPFDLEDLAGERCRILDPLGAKKSIRLEVTTHGPGRFLALGDRERTAQILDNLLENALRYSPENSQILVELEIGSSQVFCAVKDQGPGIPIDDQALVFERFYRVDSARDRRRGGAGLGLSIARSLVTAQGGEIRVVDLDGKGAVLQFWLPRAELPQN